MDSTYIVVEGNIGAGKTSLTNKLHAEFGGRVIYEEFADNAFLADFYKEPEKNAFPLELSFLAARYKQLEAVFNQKNESGFFIADYHFEKSLQFATINLNNSERAIYESIFAILNSGIRKPDLMIFLKKSIRRLQSNIEQRGRSFEVAISDEYLSKIDKMYADLIRKTGPQRYLEIDTEHLDFVNNENDYKLIISAVKAKLSAIKC
jgi:deoxyadenosine/deoxycytidine kinase